MPYPNPEYPAARRWYAVEELVEEAMAAADVVGLGRWASINQRFQYLIQGIVQRRTKAAVANFVHADDLSAFFAVLDKTDSAIGGSTALSVITPHCNWKPHDLNVMAPQDSSGRWLAFFRHHGYQGQEICLGELGEYEHPRYPVLQGTVAHAVYLFQHDKIKVQGFTALRESILTEFQNDIVLIISNSNSCMTPIIGAQTTSQMNAVTSSHIYCLYPSLTTQSIALRGYYANPADKYSPMALLSDRRDQLRVQQLTYHESSLDLN
ncbi:uncharacterized protein EV420DRAFT_1653470 [Desarmillaria tabescens]|uniref:Uncharacterized protein n=1 Tax=Armillaria tabescens TaxID=1929756 RepID=A0AA39MIW0_ARMTA|nr:uncharacterized protein EV420DRAFT_1653470 [Desarmillaria tabescens]KAK0435095.1 hypothetical protein EV420DRAFT_1653470 [Desarmillaria tabescens]